MQFKTLSLLCLAMVGSGAFAQTKPPEPDYTFAFNVGAVTDYRFRGLSQSRFDPAVQGGIDFTHKSGFYLGTWGSSIKWIKDFGGKADAEVDIYGGYRGAVGDIAYDVGALRYLYPDAKIVPSPYTTELYGAVTFGPATVKYSHAVTNIFGFADSKNSGYLEAAATFDLGKGFSVVPHIGHQRIAGNNGTNNNAFSYTDYSVTLNYDFGNGLVASVSAIGADTKKIAGVSAYTPGASASSSLGKDLGRDTVVLGLKYSF